MEKTLLEKKCKGVKLGEVFDKSKAAVADFKKKIDELKLLKNDSHLFIHEFFLELRTEIDLDRELCKDLIDTHYLDLIEEVNKIEAECKVKSAGIKRRSILKKEVNFEEFDVDLKKLRAGLDKLEIDTEEWKSIELTSKEQSKKLEVLVEDTQNELLLGKQYRFASNIESLRNEINSVRIYPKLVRLLI